MPKEEWGVKRLCPTTGKRFYDLNKNPIVSPYTGEVVEFDTNKNKTMTMDKADAQSEKNDDILDDDENSDVSLGDDVLEDDDDDDTVPLDDLADVASDDESN